MLAPFSGVIPPKYNKVGLPLLRRTRLVKDVVALTKSEALYLSYLFVPRALATDEFAGSVTVSSPPDTISCFFFF